MNIDDLRNQDIKGYIHPDGDVHERDPDYLSLGDSKTSEIQQPGGYKPYIRSENTSKYKNIDMPDIEYKNAQEIETERKLEN